MDNTEILKSASCSASPCEYNGSLVTRLTVLKLTFTALHVAVKKYIFTTLKAI